MLLSGVRFAPADLFRASLIAGAALAVFVAAPAQAQTTRVLTVDRLDDIDLGACSPNPNDCTLRGALGEATDGDFIEFDLTVFPDEVNPGVIAITQDLPEISLSNLTITGGVANSNDETPRVVIDGSGSSGTHGLVISGNRVFIRGLHIAGFSGDGIRISGSECVIGANVNPAEDTNIIVGNGGAGIRITGEDADNNVLGGNWIGQFTTNPNTGVSGNGVGVIVENGADNTQIGDNNRFVTVVGNVGDGLQLLGSGVTGTRVGRIRAGGRNLQANGRHGVFIDGATGTRFLREDQFAQNNAGDGIHIASGTGNNVANSRMRFGDNGGLAINLAAPGDPANGVTQNDAGDADSGPNDLVNWPEISGLGSAGGGESRVTGTTCAGCTVMFYEVENNADPSGHGEGEGIGSVVADASGAFTFDVALESGASITAVTIDTSGNTSEMAPNVQGPREFSVDRTDDAVVGDCDPTVANDCTFRGALGAAAPGDRITFSLSVFRNNTLRTPVALTAPLPPITLDGLTIDATGGSNRTAEGRVLLDGSGLGGTPHGFDVRADNVTISGFEIRGFGGDGIRVSGANAAIGAVECGTRGGNLLLANGGYGLRITGEDADGTFVAFNHIGVDSDLVADGNALGGVLVELGADDTRFDNALGPFCADGVIAGNQGDGIALLGAGITNTLITDVAVGITGVGNAGHGLFIDGAEGTALEFDAIFEDNSGDGVRVASGQGNRVVGRNVGYINNGGLAINLVAPGDGPDGVTDNDAGDADSGPNGLQNFPVLDSLEILDAGRFRIRGSACAGCEIFFFGTESIDPSGHGEGTYLNRVDLRDGETEINTILNNVPPNTSISAVAFDEISGNSSEMSVALQGPGEVVVDRLDDADVGACTDAPNDCTLRGAIGAISDGDAIAFDTTVFPSVANPGVILLQSALPPISANFVVLDGIEFNGGRMGGRVTLDGSQAGAGVDGLVLAGDLGSFRGFELRNFSGDGLVITGSQNEVGRNGNNPGWGIVTIGNGGFGVAFRGANHRSNLVYLARIGVDRFDNPVPNGAGGVLVDGGFAERVGNTGNGRFSQVAANDGPGIVVRGGAENALFGTLDIGLPGLGNDGHGVLVQDALQTQFSTRVRVRDNAGDGVRIEGGERHRFARRDTEFSNNGGLAINLVAPGDPPNGVTPNDPGDADTGPNTLLNQPEVRVIRSLGGGDFEVSGRACPRCTVYVYLSSPIDPSGFGEGRYLADVVADAFGTWTTEVTLNDTPVPDDHIAAVAEQDISNSEFSLALNILLSVANTAICGNGLVEAPEECDDGALDGGDGCSSICTLEGCGDGILQPDLGEACEDGNTTAGDGCSPTCQIEVCGDGVTQAPAEQCDDGQNGDDTDGCHDDCRSDRDFDTVADDDDNCPDDANTDQADADRDGIGDVCDSGDPPVGAVPASGPVGRGALALMLLGAGIWLSRRRR